MTHTCIKSLKLYMIRMVSDLSKAYTVTDQRNEVSCHGFVVVVVALLFFVHGKHLRSCRDGQLT